tara:strand:+ start:6104 stop:6682 length:579 start_codon:yes stop_codon:yes gene_type:complete
MQDYTGLDPAAANFAQQTQIADALTGEPRRVSGGYKAGMAAPQPGPQGMSPMQAARLGKNMYDAYSTLSGAGVPINQGLANSTGTITPASSGGGGAWAGPLGAAIIGKMGHEVNRGTVDEWGDYFTNPGDTSRRVAAADRDDFGQVFGEGAAQGMFAPIEGGNALIDGDLGGFAASFDDFLRAPLNVFDDWF